MKRTLQQRRAYALLRISTAVDRCILTESKQERAQVNKWIRSWKDYYFALLACRVLTDTPVTPAT